MCILLHNGNCLFVARALCFPTQTSEWASKSFSNAQMPSHCSFASIFLVQFSSRCMLPVCIFSQQHKNETKIVDVSTRSFYCIFNVIWNAFKSTVSHQTTAAEKIERNEWNRDWNGRPWKTKTECASSDLPRTSSLLFWWSTFGCADDRTERRDRFFFILSCGRSNIHWTMHQSTLSRCVRQRARQ